MALADPSFLRTLAAQPSVGVAATVLAYSVAVWLNRRGGGHPCLNPTLIAILILAAGLKAAGLDYSTYAQSASVVSFLLAPTAVVLLTVPLFRHRTLVRESGLIVAGALAVGLPTGVLSAVGIAWLLGADHQTLLSLAPKSTTAGIAIGISQLIGGLPALTAVLVIMTGIIGAVGAPLVARMVGVRDPRALGLTMGIASHGIGTARALQISEVAGAFAGLGMGLNGVLTAIMLPMAVRLF